MKRAEFQRVLGITQGQAYDILTNAVRQGRVHNEPPGKYNRNECLALIDDIRERRAVTRPEWVDQGSGAW